MVEMLRRVAEPGWLVFRDECDMRMRIALAFLTEEQMARLPHLSPATP